MLQDKFTIFFELLISVRLVNPRIALDKSYELLHLIQMLHQKVSLLMPTP
ncbi:hypothetical protein RO3G_07748 [Rhizopus delemar RA 99-880]|uniref:Uncharacterized protein n=1 Tax=Rhizopus delemar (strain RA 99-880 / ATCC MYA-4621 / FGSC 9543 / NRRL 43880) TaxID=246409 RepID=I1C3L3_RHIO9|nr:hypothetical protein RO3G_07748 [Rhizopus delemar RA 99-880]|eukprot:EIE83043.1 hypothetical protein RO3G_07748 [Rhizopus delemar RA 99-880]